MTRPRVAVLGAGVMGASAALFLARRGAEVVLFDAAPQPLAGASRWNEGKIHLGYLYSADPSLATARRVIPGGLAFKPLMEELIGRALDPVTTAADDIYLCHRQSVVSAAAMGHYFNAVSDLVRESADASRYLVDVSACRSEPIAGSDLDRLADGREIVAGFRVPERSVATTWVADRLAEAIAAEPRIETVLATRVAGAAPAVVGEIEGPWTVATEAGPHSGFDWVVNALWEGKLGIDRTAGLAPEGAWSHRYRLSLFARTERQVETPSMVIATGPFGDVKNYNGRDFYLSWYPSGLVCEGTAVAPPAIPDLDDAARSRIARSVLDSLGALLPGVRGIGESAERIEVAGGWVFAMGQGSLADPGATLHRRADFGVRMRGRYVSIDTGKYSTAPWLAQRLAARIMAG